MGWLAGILSGYADRHHEIRAENAALDAQAAQREADIYKQLLNSDDPEIQGMAATGILQMGQGRKAQSGFAGWMGKMQSSPVYPTLMKYMSTPKQVDREVTIPGLSTTSKTGYTSLMPEVKGSLSLPATAATEGGAVTPPQPLPGSVQPTPPPTPPQFEPPAAPAANPDPGILQQVPPGTTVGADPGINAQIPPGTTVGADPGIQVGGGAQDPGDNPYLQRLFAQSPPPGATPPATPARRNIFANAPPAPPAAEAAAAPAAAAPPPSGPPVPPSVFTTQHVAGPAVGRTDVTTTYETPHFPTAEEQATKLALAKERADYLAAVEMFARSGDPDPEKAASDFIVASKQRTAGVSAYKPVTVEFLGPDGQVHRALASFNAQLGRYQDANGNPLPPDATTVDKTTGRAYNKREEIAAAKFGREGEDPIAVNRRLTPKERKIVLREEGIIAAEAALARAEATANAPLSMSAKVNLTMKLANEWQEISKPQNALKVQLDRMKVGLDRYDQDPNGASQVILMTFNKLLDPDSVVREGEYDRSKHGVGILNQIQGWWEKYGGRIDPQTGRLVAGGAAIPLSDLREMALTARAFSEGMQEHNEEQRQRLEFMASQHSIDPRGIFGGPPPPAVAEVPQPGGGGVTTGGAAGAGGTTTAAPGGGPPGKARFEKDEKGNWTVVR